MPRENNFLLGRGERLTSRVQIDGGDGPKHPPYDFDEAREHLLVSLGRVVKAVRELPDETCPAGQALATITVHPRYLSKSDNVQPMLSSVGLRLVGGRSRLVSPRKWGVIEHPEVALSDDLFVAGLRTSFEGWLAALPNWRPDTPPASKYLVQIEEMSPYTAADKVRNVTDTMASTVFEVVLHNPSGIPVVSAFAEYVRGLGSYALI